MDELEDWNKSEREKKRKQRKMEIQDCGDEIKMVDRMAMWVAVGYTEDRGESVGVG